MSTFTKLQKYLSSKNIAELLDDEKLKEIGEDVVQGYEVDDKSRQDWLEINREAMKIIKHAENHSEEERNSIFKGQAKLIFPLLMQATMQLSARLIKQVVRNGVAVEFAVMGKDQLIVDQQSGQPIPGMYYKAEKARRASALMNYDLLKKSKTWLSDTHKLLQVVSGWGIGFKQVYYDYLTKQNCSEFIHPENVVINHNITCLDKAPRVTIKHWLTKNEIIENVRSGYFLDLDLDNLSEDQGEDSKNDYEEKQPTHLFLCQTCYIDLDDDDYLEPYKVYVHKESKQVFCIVPAFEYEDIQINQDSEVIKIERRLDIVDFHAVDDPEGGYYSIGLNYILLHPNKALTAIQRQLIDAGTLANAAAVSGFATKAFKTKERRIRMELGVFHVLDCNPNVDPTKQLIPMPFREPSQVLLNLFQLLIEINNKNGFLSDILTGDVEMQNVPATTSLAFLEQATRVFAPIVEKEFMSFKTEYQMLFHLYSKHLDQPRYVNLQDDTLAVQSEDFDESSLDIIPVADPTMSSDAFKYARTRGLMEAQQVFGGVTNLQEAALRYYTDIGYTDPQKLIQVQQQQPDPKIIVAQLQHQIEQQKLQIEQAKLQLEQQKMQNQQLQIGIRSGQAMAKAKESGAKIKKLESDAVMNYGNLDLEQQRLGIEQQKADAAMIAAKNKGNNSNE